MGVGAHAPEAESFLSIFMQKRSQNYDNSPPCPRQTASRSQNQPLDLVTGEGRGGAPCPPVSGFDTVWENVNKELL